MEVTIANHIHTRTMPHTNTAIKDSPLACRYADTVAPSEFTERAERPQEKPDDGQQCQECELVALQQTQTKAGHPEAWGANEVHRAHVREDPMGHPARRKKHRAPAGPQWTRSATRQTK